MFDEKRIKEAEKNVRQYIQDNLLTRIPIPRKEIMDTYKRNYKESFEDSCRLADTYDIRFKVVAGIPETFHAFVL